MKKIKERFSTIRKSTLVSDIMTKDVISLPREEKVFNAIKIMSEKSISTVLILDGKKPAGIVTERDLVTRVLLKEKDPKKLMLKDIMTSGPKTIHPNAPILVASNEMKRHNVRKLVVIDNKGEAIGIISQTDIINILNKIYENYRLMLGNPLISIITILAILLIVVLSFVIRGQ